MKKFELYHPIFTDHFVLDWLTHSKIRDIYRLRHYSMVAEQSDRETDSTIEATTTYVNETMRLVMKNQALIWGISTKTEHEFLGIFCIQDLDQGTKSAAIHFEILPSKQRQGIMEEILKRMIIFSFEELNLQELYAIVPKNNLGVCTFLKHMGFNVDPAASDEQHTTFQLSRH